MGLMPGMQALNGVPIAGRGESRRLNAMCDQATLGTPGNRIRNKKTHPMRRAPAARFFRSVLALAFLATSQAIEAVDSPNRRTAATRQTPITVSAATRNVDSEQASALRAALLDYAVIRMDPAAVSAQVKESGELALMHKGFPFHFHMQRRDLRSPRYRAESTGEEGVRRQIHPGPVTTYRGTAQVGPEIVQGRFTIAGSRFEGVVFTPEDWHFIEPLQSFVPTAANDAFVVYKQSDIKPGQGWRCGVSHRLQYGRDRLAAQRAFKDTTTTYTVEIATEADYEYVEYWGGAASANREIRAILNQVEGVYEPEVKLTVEIVFQHAWSSSNDPYTTTDASELLDQFREHWNANFLDAEGYDLAHLWTGKQQLTHENENGEEITLGGFAHIATVCGSRHRYYGYGAYGLSKRHDYSNEKLIIAAHEIGHNFSAGHPDELEPPVSSCADTLMQSRFNQYTRTSFCQFSRDEIRDHVSAYNSCLEAVPGTITIGPPSNLTAVPIDSTQIRLTWNDNSDNEAGFRVGRRAPGEEWDLLVALGTNRTAFIDAGLAPSTPYSYQVAAFGEDTDGEPITAQSEIATATTLGSDPSGDGANPDLTRWVIPTTVNSPGREGAYYRTKVLLVNFDSDLDLTMRLYGPRGLVDRRSRSIEANHYWTWSNLLDDLFNYEGAGAVEFSGNAPFTVSAEVYTTSSRGNYTTVVHNGPVPLRPYLTRARSVGVVAVDGSTRTNAGVFNSSNRSQTVTARVYYPDSDSDDAGQTLTFSLPPKGWAQKPVSARGVRGYILWSVPREAYLWVVNVDNRSNDGTLVFPVAP